MMVAVLPVRLEAGHDGRVAAVPAGSGTSAGLARLLLIAARSDAVGTWQRLKACGADDCQWAFYDRSPTQNGCWCTMQLCGARAKSRAYRRRAGNSPRQRRAPAAG
jgi:predicted RNA-binding Zn ribbon-like protein